MIVYRDLYIDEWWAYENGQWWNLKSWKVIKWVPAPVGPSLGSLMDEFIVESSEGEFHNTKGYSIKLK